MLALGYLGAAFMGLTLGLIGGGGSILAVPILVYFFGVPGSYATFYSLFIVGLCAAAGTLPMARRGLVAPKTGFSFFLPSVVGVLTSRRLILPALPAGFHWGSFSFSKDVLILFVFGIVMLAASISMLKPSSRATPAQAATPPLQSALVGIAVGLMTGFVGAGGGFLIVPALVSGLSLPVQKAIGTSLFIIALNSLTGFTGDLLSGSIADWSLIAPFSAVSLAGLLVGTFLNRIIPAQKLKPLFGWFVLILGSAMVIKQVLELRSG